MVQFIEKNGEFFLRKQHDFALREDAARELISQGILPGTNIAQFYFDSLVQANTKIAILSSHLIYEDDDDQATDTSEECADEGESNEVETNQDPLNVRGRGQEFIIDIISYLPRVVDLRNTKPFHGNHSLSA